MEGPIVQALALKDLVRERLEALILDGTYKPGDRLVESELANIFGVSRGPVREAIQLLKEIGWIDVEPRRGAFVHRPTAAEISDFFEVRRLLEAESARLATRHATALDIEDLREICSLGTSMLGHSDMESLSRANAEFHSRVAEAGRNATLSQMRHGLAKRATWFVGPIAMERRFAAWQEHAAIVDAISSGDEDLAAELMAAHTLYSREAYQSLADRIADGSWPILSDG